MTAEQTPDLAAALAAARRPLERRDMPSAELRVRVKTSPWLRRLLPTRLVVRRAVAKGQATWEDNVKEHRRALEAMTAIVGGTARAGEVGELARLHLIEEEANKALFWQPWTRARMDVGSSAHLQTALSAGRGVLLSSCHLGPIFRSRSSISSAGRILYVVSAPWFFDEPSPDYWGRRIVRWWRGLERWNERLVYSVGAFPVVQAMLEQGEIVLLYFDMPGSRHTRFLGKSVMLSSSSARLAVNSDALILPIRPRREGHRVWTDVNEALDPRDFAGADELHDAVAQVHERWILEAPWTSEDPRRPGAWEQGATADAWIRSEPSGAQSGVPAHDGDRPAPPVAV
jgi:hypothetical protein